MMMRFSTWAICFKVSISPLSFMKINQSINQCQPCTSTALRDRGVSMVYPRGGDITAIDITEGHREKTLTLLWRLIFHCELTSILDVAALKDEIRCLEKEISLASKSYVEQLVLLSWVQPLQHIFLQLPSSLSHRIRTFNQNNSRSSCVGAILFALFPHPPHLKLTTSPPASLMGGSSARSSLITFLTSSCHLIFGNSPPKIRSSQSRMRTPAWLRITPSLSSCTSAPVIAPSR